MVKALLSIVESWFLSERCRKHDRTLIQRMLAGQAPEGFSNAQDLSRQALIEAIYALGKNPYGNNYLAPHIQLLIEDPIFSEVRDRSNANFLWFVKFESSFAQAEKEAEQELQSERSAESAEFSQSLPGLYDQDKETYEATIIAFSTQAAKGQQDQSKSKRIRQSASRSGSCDIIPFSQF